MKKLYLEGMNFTKTGRVSKAKGGGSGHHA